MILTSKRSKWVGRVGWRKDIHKRRSGKDYMNHGPLDSLDFIGGVVIQKCLALEWYQGEKWNKISSW